MHHFALIRTVNYVNEITEMEKSHEEIVEKWRLGESECQSLITKELERFDCLHNCVVGSLN